MELTPTDQGVIMFTPGFLTVSETAKRIGISRSSLYSLLSQSVIPVYRCGEGHRQIRIAEEDINDFVEQCRLGVEGRFRRPSIKELVTEPLNARS